MTIRVSTGLRSSMVWFYGLTAVMNGGHIRLYGGASQPPSADHPPAGSLLGFVSTDGVTPLAGQPAGGLQLALVGPGTLGMGGNWVLRGTASGTVTWWRFIWNDVDSNTFSDYYPRIDGAVGESLFLASDQITSLTEATVNGFNLVFPFQ